MTFFGATGLHTIRSPFLKFGFLVGRDAEIGEVYALSVFVIGGLLRTAGFVISEN